MKVRKLSANGLGGLKALFNNYKYQAKRAQREFCLTLEQFRNLTSSPCYYCHCHPHKTRKTPYKGGDIEAWNDTAYLFNGIDRIDSDLGYVLSNCLPCCHPCNRTKSAMSSKDILRIERLLSILKTLKAA